MKNNAYKGNAGGSLAAAIVFTLLAVLGIVLIVIGAIGDSFDVIPFIIGIVLTLCFGFACIPMWIGFKSALENKKRHSNTTETIE